MPQFLKLPSLPVQLAARLPAAFYACGVKALSPCREQPAICLRKPAAGSFAAGTDDASRTVRFLLCAAKETKPPHAGRRKDVIYYGNLSSGSKGCQPGYWAFRLCGFGLFKLF
ncbi:MAG: hypothetical protein K6E30_07030 [Lachnospiraceae bacterium]|nr:hypothetical protein [Lachnospiraceae bacterium]